MKHDNTPQFPWPLLSYWIHCILPVWGLIALVIFLFQIAICGIMHDNESVKAFLQFIDMMPSFVKSMLGGSALQVGNVSALIAIGYNHPMTLILYMLYAVGVPTALLSSEIQRGTMELILSRHVTKLQVYVCAGLITTIGMFLLVLVMFLGTVAGTTIYPFAQAVPYHSFLRLAISGGLLASAVGAIALLSAASFRHKHMAVGATVAFLVVNYFVSVIAVWWPRMAWLSPTTIFYYAGEVDIFVHNAWPVKDMSVLIGLLVTASLAGAIIWQRRDLPL
jgi:ABC-2 type transport system permease protein